MTRLELTATGSTPRTVTHDAMRESLTLAFLAALAGLCLALAIWLDIPAWVRAPLAIGGSVLAVLVWNEHRRVEAAHKRAVAYIAAQTTPAEHYIAPTVPPAIDTFMHKHGGIVEQVAKIDPVDEALTADLLSFLAKSIDPHEGGQSKRIKSDAALGMSYREWRRMKIALGDAMASDGNRGSKLTGTHTIASLMDDLKSGRTLPYRLEMPISENRLRMGRGK